MIIFASEGPIGVDLAVADVLGSKTFNNALLLAVAKFAIISHGRIQTSIKQKTILDYQIILVTTFNIIALIPMFRLEIGPRVGLMSARNVHS